MKRLSDTSPEADRVLTECYRRMTSERKISLVEDAIRTARLLHESGYRARHPEATAKDVHIDWVRQTLGEAMAALARKEWPMSGQPTEAVRVTQEVMEALRQLGVACALGGSFASSVHGRSRQTQDADVMAEPFLGREAAFVARLGRNYYFSTQAIRDANHDRSSFNVIHTSTAFKVDVFIQKDRPFDRSALQRRVWRKFAKEP